MILIFVIFGNDIIQIYATFGTYGLYMNKIVPMYKFDMIQARFQQGSEGVQRYQNSLYFGRGRGVIKNQLFPKLKKVQIMGGGQKNYGLFPKIKTFFVWMLPSVFLRQSLQRKKHTLQVLFQVFEKGEERYSPPHSGPKSRSTLP